MHFICQGNNTAMKCCFKLYFRSSELNCKDTTKFWQIRHDKIIILFPNIFHVYLFSSIIELNVLNNRLHRNWYIHLDLRVRVNFNFKKSNNNFSHRHKFFPLTLNICLSSWHDMFVTRARKKTGKIFKNKSRNRLFM